jgi:hypothetical protein
MLQSKVISFTPCPNLQWDLNIYYASIGWEDGEGSSSAVLVNAMMALQIFGRILGLGVVQGSMN